MDKSGWKMATKHIINNKWRQKSDHCFHSVWYCTNPGWLLLYLACEGQNNTAPPWITLWVNSIQSVDCSTILFFAIVSYMSHSLMGTIKTGPLLYPCRPLHHWALNECRAVFKAGHYHLPDILSCLTVHVRICERGDSAEKSINLTNLTSWKGSS